MIIAILAGGSAVRLGALTKHTPKSMLPIQGEPFIGHQLRLLADNGIKEVHLCLGLLSEPVLDYVGNGSRFGLEVSHTVEKDQLLGTAGALVLAKDYLGERFGVLYGDSYLPLPYRKICDAFERCETDAMMTVWKNNNSFDRSNLVVEGGLVRAYSSKRDDPEKYMWIDYGFSFLQSKVLAKIDASKPVQLSEIWRDLICHEKLSAYVVNRRFYEIGSLSGYEELCRLAEQEGMPEGRIKRTGFFNRKFEYR